MKNDYKKNAIVQAIGSVFDLELTPFHASKESANVLPEDSIVLNGGASNKLTSAVLPAQRSDPIFDWNIVDIKRKISEFSIQGKLSHDLVELLCKDGLCAPVECELLDYKETIGNNPYEKAKLALRVVSFFNSLGGYLVFGVTEVEADSKQRFVEQSWELLKGKAHDAIGRHLHHPV